MQRYIYALLALALSANGQTTVFGRSNSGTSATAPQYMVWTPPGSCGPQFANCFGSPQWTPSAKITITSMTMQATTAPAGCTTLGSYILKQNNTTALATITFVNGQNAYVGTGFPINVDPANGYLQMVTGGTASAGCTTNASSIFFAIEYQMQAGGVNGTAYTFNAPLASSGSIVSHNSSGVAPGSYTCLTATINTFGLVTTASNGTCGGGGSGTVTHTVGALTANQLVFGNGAADIKSGDLTGDVSTAGTTATTLATVNGTPGSYGSSSAIPVFSVDAKGRITTITTATVSGGGGGGTGIASGTSLPATCTPGTDTLYLKTNNAPNQQIYSCSALNTWTQNEVLGASGGLSIDGTTGALDIVTSVVPRITAANAFTGRNGFTISDFTMQAAPAAPGTGKLSIYANNDGTFHVINAAGTDSAIGGGGSSTWNGITNPTGNQALSMGSNTSTWTWGAATGANNLVTLIDTANNTGTGFLLDVETAAGSAAGPIRIKSSNTSGVNINYTASSTAANAYFGVAGPNKYPPGGAGGPGSGFVAADNDIVIMPAGTARWDFPTNGHFLAAVDANYDIGQPGANRPRSIYAARRVVSGVNTATYAANTTFDLSLGDVQTVTMTGNITTLTLSNMSAGQRVVFDFVQDATGNRTVAYPAAVHGGTAPGTVASKHNVQEFYSPDGTNLYAVAQGITNQ